MKSNISVEALLARIAAGKLPAAILLLGSDSYLRERVREALIAKFVPEGAREWAVFKTSAREGGWEDALGRARMLPMLSPRQIILIEDSAALEMGGEEAAERAAEEMEEYLRDPAPFSIVVFQAEDLDQRRKIAKVLLEHALVCELSAGDDLRGLLTQIAHEAHAEIDARAADELIEAVNGQPSRLRMEMEKLATYAGGRCIESADVEHLVFAERRTDVWKLAEMLVRRDARRSLEFLDFLLREGEQPASILGALAWMYHKLIEAREMGAGTSEFTAARELGMRIETARIALDQSRKIPREQLLAGVVALAEADSSVKSGGKSQRATMEFLLARLCTAKPTV